MPELERMRDLLVDMNLQAVARGSGVHPNVLYRIVSGKNNNPSYETVRKVMTYLETRTAANE